MFRLKNCVRTSIKTMKQTQVSEKKTIATLVPLLGFAGVGVASCESSEPTPKKGVQTGVIRYMIDEDGTNKRQSNFVYNLYVPLVYAAVFPLVRIVGRGRVPVQTINKVQIGLVFAAFVHAGYIMGSDSSM